MDETFLEGLVDEIIYSNPDNGYTVLILNCMGEPITLVGIMPYLNEGESVKVQGTWSVHPTYGRQFRVSFMEKALPTSSESIEKYLASGAVKGIGPVLAKRLTDAYGEDTLDVIEHHHRWLCDIRGISPKKADEIHQQYEEQFGVRTIMIHFSQYFGPNTSVKIYKLYGSAAIDLVNQNPYRLCDEIERISFERADSYAQSIGFDQNSEERIRAGVFHVLNQAAFQSGHCRLPREQLLSQAASILSVPENRIFDVLECLCLKKELFQTADQDSVYYATAELYSAERYVAAKLTALSEERIPLKLTGIDDKIRELEQQSNIEYAEEQKQAIRFATSCGLTIVTGGPGTGKTTVIKAILNVFDEVKFPYLLAAPTGRAAKRMSEASGKEAKTIHRLLESTIDEKGELTFQREENNPLSCKALIIDEVSMVDTLLMEALLKAVKLGTYVVLIGDADQLPPVGPGNCLSTLLESSRFPIVRLNKIFRQAEESLIIVNAHRINQGEMPFLNIRDNDFFFMERHTAEDIQDTILQLCESRLPITYKVDPLKDIQVICWTKKGPLGTVDLNNLLQARLNPPSSLRREKKVGSRIFREGDKVMQIRNNYDLTWSRDNEEGSGIFNGDIGTIKHINPMGEYLLIDFDGRSCEYDFSLLEDLELAYAITTHKSQGSEYRFVLIPSFDAAYPLLTRNILYTSVTRAKEMVCIVGKQTIISTMVQNNRKPIRYSSMKDFLSLDSSIGGSQCEQ